MRFGDCGGHARFRCRARRAKMLVFGDPHVCGNVWRGKFEALVVERRLRLARGGRRAQDLPAARGRCESFGAICGGEATVLIEPQLSGEALFIVGVGTVRARWRDRAGLRLARHGPRRPRRSCSPIFRRSNASAQPAAPEFIAGAWQRDEALVLLSRNHELDREARRCLYGGIGYLGMIGSRRKVRQVFEDLLRAEWRRTARVFCA